jgi:hypothetical protein
LKCSQDKEIVKRESKKQMETMSERTRTYLINREGIGFFKAILESYEDLGIFTVLDGSKGLIELIYSSHFEDDIEGIVEDMAHYGIELREVRDVR